MGRIIGVPLRRRLSGRWVWSSLLAGTIAWSGHKLPAYALAAENAALNGPAPARLASREPVLPSAIVPGAEAPALASGGWSFSASGGSDFSFTDNVYLTDTNRLSDFIFSPRASFTARHATPRSTLNANAEVAYDYYATNTRLNGARPSALIDGLAVIIEDNFTLAGRLATDVQQVTNEERAPVIERNLDRNQTQILNYGLTPTLRARLGSVEAKASYDYAAVYFLDPPVGDSIIQGGDTQRHTVSGKIGAVPDAGATLIWSASGTYERSRMDNLIDANGIMGQQPERANAEGRAEYRLSAPLALTARGGYDWIEEPTLRAAPDGGYGLVGAMWRPSPRTYVRAEAGHRYRDFNAEADIHYQASQALIVTASYRRDVQTGQRLLLDSLEALGRDQFGNLVDPITGLPPDPNATRFGLNNQAFRRDQFRIGLHGRAQRTFYSLSADFEQRDADGLGGKSRGLSGLIGRDLTPRLQASVSATLARATADSGLTFSVGDSKTTSAGVRLDYRHSPSVRSGLRYAHMRRETTLVRYRENALILSVIKEF